MLHEWDAVEERSRAEGQGQIEWQRSGPGLRFANNSSPTPAERRDRRGSERVASAPARHRPRERARPRACGRVRDAAPGEGATLRASAALRPLLIASLLSDDRGLAGRPALLTAIWQPIFAPTWRRGGSVTTPTRGTGYASRSAPPHLVGLRDRRPRRALSGDRPGGRGQRGGARPRQFRTPRFAPPGSLSRAARRSTSAHSEMTSSPQATSGSSRSPSGQFAVRGLDVFPATEERGGVRIELFGDEIELDALVLDLHPALAPGGRADRGGARRRAATQVAAERQEAEPAPAGRTPDAKPRSAGHGFPCSLEHFRAPLELIAGTGDPQPGR